MAPYHRMAHPITQEELMVYLMITTATSYAMLLLLLLPPWTLLMVTDLSAGAGAIGWSGAFAVAAVDAPAAMHACMYAPHLVARAAIASWPAWSRA